MNPSRPAPIYLDHSAGAPLCAAARAAIAELLDGDLANASSIHLPGQRARRIVDAAREAVAALVGARPGEVVFTSGATEANLLAWRGVMSALGPAGQGPWRGVSCRTEHPSVLAAAEVASKAGWQLLWLDVNRHGALDLDAVERLLSGAPGATPGGLLSLMAVNNETGLCHPTAPLAALARRHGLVHHCDATQAVGRLAVDMCAWDLDLLSLSGHKFGAPAGVGALVIRRGATFAPPVAGHQEHGMRAGTENLLGIAALGAAAAAAPARLAQAERVRALRDHAWQVLAATISGARRNGAEANESGHILNVAFADVPGDLLAMALDLEDVSVSTGSACTSGTLAPSHVLLAMAGDDPVRQRGCAEAIRISLGPDTTAAEVDRLLILLPDVVERIRQRAG